jgi:hypothetical protein
MIKLLVTVRKDDDDDDGDDDDDDDDDGSTLDRWFQPRSGQSKDHTTGNCCIFVKHPQLKSTSKDWLTRNPNIVSE